MAGDASSIDWTVASASDSGATSATVSARTAREARGKRIGDVGEAEPLFALCSPIIERVAGRIKPTLRDRRLLSGIAPGTHKNVAARILVHMPRGDEQIIRQAVEIGQAPPD